MIRPYNLKPLRIVIKTFIPEPTIRPYKLYFKSTIRPLKNVDKSIIGPRY